MKNNKVYRDASWWNVECMVRPIVYTVVSITKNGTRERVECPSEKSAYEHMCRNLKNEICSWVEKIEIKE